MALIHALNTGKRLLTTSRQGNTEAEAYLRERVRQEESVYQMQPQERYSVAGMTTWFKQLGRSRGIRGSTTLEKLHSATQYHASGSHPKKLLVNALCRGVV
jgi:hypothetical protein